MCSVDAFIQNCKKDVSQQCVLRTWMPNQIINHRSQPTLVHIRAELMKNARCTQHPLLDPCGVSCRHHHLNIPTDVAAALRTSTVQLLVEDRKTWPDFLCMASDHDHETLTTTTNVYSNRGKGITIPLTEEEVLEYSRKDHLDIWERRSKGAFLTLQQQAVLKVASLISCGGRLGKRATKNRIQQHPLPMGLRDDIYHSVIMNRAEFDYFWYYLHRTMKYYEDHSIAKPYGDMATFYIKNYYYYCEPGEILWGAVKGITQLDNMFHAMWRKRRVAHVGALILLTRHINIVERVSY